MHGHPPDHDGASARLGLARGTRGKAANNSSTATTSHQVPSAARLHSQSCGHMGSREHRRQNALPNLPAESVCRHSCSAGAHVCAMVARDNGHVCGTKHPACKHRWDKKATEQESRRIGKRYRRRWGPAVGMDDNSQPAVEQKQAAVAEQYFDYLDSLSQSSCHRRIMVPQELCRQEQHQPRDRRKPQVVRALGRRITLWCLIPQAALGRTFSRS